MNCFLRNHFFAFFFSFLKVKFANLWNFYQRKIIESFYFEIYIYKIKKNLYCSLLNGPVKYTFPNVFKCYTTNRIEFDLQTFEKLQHTQCKSLSI